jgi:predicted transcriptional regulator
MHARNIKGVPTVRDSKLIGIVACSDFIRALAKKLDETSRAASALRKTLNEALRRRHEDISR